DPASGGSIVAVLDQDSSIGHRSVRQLAVRDTERRPRTIPRLPTPCTPHRFPSTLASTNSPRTIAISTKPVLHARSICDCFELLYRCHMLSGRLACAPENGFQFIRYEPNDVMISGAVSPTPRATPRMTAVTSPLRAVGRTTRRTVCHSGPPRAKE